MKEKIDIKRIIITLVVGLIFYYFMLPPINITSPAFWSFLVIILIIYLVQGIFKSKEIIELIITGRKIERKSVLVYVILGLFILILGVNFILSPLFNSNSYASRISVNEDTSFTTDIIEVNFNAIPLLDKDSSQKLGDRVMGQMPELVSQFLVSDLYTQINYNNDIVRVTPLEYSDIFKYFTNRNDGVKGYITVNSVSGEANLIKLDKGMKYMPSAYFFENLDRYLRLKYPFDILGNESFEIDNEGNPYWIIPTIEYSGVGLKKEINGVIILNPIDGSTKKYKIEDIPTWVDHAYESDLIIEQVDDWGKYQNGFFNSIFGQKGVVKTTRGYNYIAMNDDVYLYTGITSAVSDESNLGFILTNMRTKETNFYSVPGAEEYSAMASAEGQVQQMKYNATFPLLINLNNRPTYLISLKDNAGLVKMYAFVDVADYQKVVVTDSSKGIEEAAKNYLMSFSEEINSELLKSKTITIRNINNALIDGTTYYYIIDTEGNKYRTSIKTNEIKLPFLISGDTINISYMNEEEVTQIMNIE